MRAILNGDWRALSTLKPHLRVADEAGRDDPGVGLAGQDLRALAVRATQRGYKVRFTTGADLVFQLEKDRPADSK